MKSNEVKYWWYDLIGHSFFIGFLLFGIIFFKERMFNCDAAYYTWHLTNYEAIFVKHQRWINYLIQLPAWIGIKAGVSLKTAIVLYSATFGSLFYLGFLFVRYKFKDPLSALFLVLSLALAIRYKHFAGSSEIIVAIFEAALFLGFVTSDRFKRSIKPVFGHWLFIVIMLFALTMTHPVIVVPIMIILGFEFLSEERWKERKLWIVTALTLLAFGMRLMISSGDDYESNKMGILKNAFDVLIHPGEYYVYEIIVDYIVRDYLPVLALVAYTVYRLSTRRKILTVFYYILANIAFLFLIIVIESYLRSDVLFMIDGYLGMFGLIWGIPIIKYLALKPDKNYVLSVIAVILFCCIMIVSKSRFYQKRLHNYRVLLEQYEPHRKLYADMKFYDWDKFWYPYEVPLETLMLTGLEGPENCATLFFNFEYKPEENYLQESDEFYNFGNSTPQHTLNSRYYQLPESRYIKVDSVPWKEVD